MEDQQIIDLYWQRDARALAETGKKYGNYCFCVANHILASRQDCEECVNDTWMQAWQTMPPYRPKVLRLFLARLTRSLAFNRFKAQSTQKRGGGQIDAVLDELEECLSEGSSVEDQVIAAQLGQSISAFVRQLPAREAGLFVRRYFFTESVEEIAGRYELTTNHTAVLLSRTRKKLKKHLMEEGYLNG